MEVIQIGPYTYEVRLNGTLLGVIEHSRPGIWVIAGYTQTKDEAVAALVAAATHLTRF